MSSGQALPAPGEPPAQRLISTGPSDQWTERHGTARRRAVGAAILAVCLVLAIVASLVVGARSIPVATVWAALTGADSGADASVVLTLRVPRTVLGILVGAGLGVAGALIQAVTRNPLADPGILGVNAGAAFAVAFGVGVLGVTAPLGYIWFAFGGALLATVIVYLIGAAGAGPISPARITLAGVAMGAVLTGITSAMLLADPKAYNAMRAWQAGSLADRGWTVIEAAGPFLAVGILIAVLLGHSLNAVALGDDLAHALGTSIGRTRVLAVAVVTLLAGAATAMAGPIAFVGLMIPHVARWIVGTDQRWIVAYSVLAAPALLLAADVIGRVVIRPGEVPVGVVAAFLGAPVLIGLVRHRRASAL